MRKPDFYLASSEGYGLEEPRGCWRLKSLRLKNGKELLLVKVHPSIHYLDKNLEQVVLAARHQGYSVTSIQEWPCYVHVARLMHADIPADCILKSKDLEVIAWAELYPDEMINR